MTAHHVFKPPPDTEAAVESAETCRLTQSGRLPLEGVLAFCPEKVNMGLELQFEDVLLVDAVGFFGGADRVAEQGEAGQREVVLQTETERFSVQLRSTSCLFEELKRRCGLTW